MSGSYRSQPSTRLAEIVGCAALLLGSLAGAQTVPAHKAKPAPAHAPTLRHEFDFDEIGGYQINSLAWNDRAHNRHIGTYLSHRGEIDQRVAEARTKTDPGSLRLVAWDDMTKLAAQISDPQLKAQAIENIVTTLIKYDDKAAQEADADPREQPGDLSTVEIIAGGDGDKGLALCLGFATVFMETGIRAGIAPRDIAVVSTRFVSIADGRFMGQHAYGETNAGGDKLIFEQDGLHTEAEFLKPENSAIPGTRMMPVSAETLDILAIHGDGAAILPKAAVKNKTTHMVSDHDFQSWFQISDRIEKLKTDIEASKAVQPAIKPMPAVARTGLGR